MKTFQSRTLFVEAVRWDGHLEHPEDLPLESGLFWTAGEKAFLISPEGIRQVAVGDWIVKDASGAYLPMSDELFMERYELAGGRRSGV
jgi:hypothetical protein